MFFEDRQTALQAGDILVFSLDTFLLQFMRKDSGESLKSVRWDIEGRNSDVKCYFPAINCRGYFVDFCHLLANSHNLTVNIDPPKPPEKHQKEVWRATLVART